MKTKIYKLLSNAKHGLFALAVVASGTAQSQTTFSFSFTGAVQTLTLPAGSWGLECWGANGGSITTLGGEGIGGYSKGAYNITTSGTQVNIFVGGKGAPASGLLSGSAGAGGWNGGGGGSQIGSTGAGGGGATDVRIGGTAAPNRVIVAGGGGGASGYFSQTPNGVLAAGGHGGGLTGANGNTITSGGVITVGGGGQGANGALPGISPVGGTADGTSTGGGGGAYSANGASAGGQGTGGGAGGAAGISGGGSTGAAGGGGGGYAGGAGGVQNNNGGCAGGGGSGYIGGVTNGITTQSAQTGFVPNPDNSGNGYVVITRLCDLQITASKNPICEGESITLSSNAGSNILWNTGATTSSISVSPTSSTSYTVSGVSTSTMACTSTVSILVVVNPLPAISVYSFPPVICEGGNGTLGASGAATYSWSNGNTGASVPVTPNLSSVYTVTGTSAAGCVNTQTVAVTVNTNSLAVSQNTSVCKGSSVNLTAGGVSSAMWSNGSGFLTISVTPTANTIYTVSGTDALGCTLTNSVSVTVMDLPAVTITSNKDIVCRGESATLTANGGANYVWDSAETTSVVIKSIPVNVAYQFSVTGTDANGCSASAMITVNGSACTAIDEKEMKAINVFPSPVNNEITVSGLNPAKKIIVISDLHGKTLISTETSDTSLKLNVANLPAGVYNIQVTEGNGSTVQKFIKL